VVDVQHALDGNRRFLLPLLLRVPLLLLVARVLVALARLLSGLTLRLRLPGLGRLRLGRRASGRLAFGGGLRVGDRRLRLQWRGHVAVGSALALCCVSVRRRLARRHVAVRSRLLGALVQIVVLDVDDAALRVERRLHLALTVLAVSALAATAAAAPALPAEPAAPATFAGLTLPRLAVGAVGPVLAGLRKSRVARLRRIR
jgi:hypothetical protein